MAKQMNFTSNSRMLYPLSDDCPPGHTHREREKEMKEHRNSRQLEIDSRLAEKILCNK